MRRLRAIPDFERQSVATLPRAVLALGVLCLLLTAWKWCQLLSRQSWPVTTATLVDTSWQRSTNLVSSRTGTHPTLEERAAWRFEYQVAGKTYSLTKRPSPAANAPLPRAADGLSAEVQYNFNDPTEAYFKADGRPIGLMLLGTLLTSWGAWKERHAIPRWLQRCRCS